MPCNKLTSLTGCNRCKLHVGDIEFLKIVRSEAIARVCLYLVKNDAIFDKLIDYDSITVSCSGSIAFEKKVTEITDTYIIFKQNVLTCGKIADRWCINHRPELNTIVGCTMTNISSNINTLSNMYALREYFTKLVKYLRDITICNEMCNTVTINKLVSNCILTLKDNRDLRKIDDPIVILEALNQAIYAYRATSVKKAFLDISDIKVKCNGTIILPSKYIYTNNPKDRLTEKCIEILSEWLSRHNYHRTTPYIIDIIDRCKKAEDIRELHMVLQRGIGCIEGFIFFD